MAVGMGSLSLGWSLLWGGGAHPPALGLPCVREGAALCTPLFILPPPGGGWMHTGIRGVGWGGGCPEGTPQRGGGAKRTKALSCPSTPPLMLSALCGTTLSLPAALRADGLISWEG